MAINAVRTRSSPSCGRPSCSSRCCSSCSHSPFSFASLVAAPRRQLPYMSHLRHPHTSCCTLRSSCWKTLSFTDSSGSHTCWASGTRPSLTTCSAASGGSASKWPTSFRYGSSSRPLFKQVLYVSSFLIHCIKMAFYEYSMAHAVGS